MDTFRAYHADILDPAQQPRVVALLREHGLVTFTGITDRTELASAAHGLTRIRPHRDAGPDGVTVITDTQTTDPGYAAFTDAELIPTPTGPACPTRPTCSCWPASSPPATAGIRCSPTPPASPRPSPGSTPPPWKRCQRHGPPTSAPRADTSARSASRPAPAGHTSGSASMTWPCSPPTPPL